VKASVRLAGTSDVADLEGRLRAADLVELKAHGVTAEQALRLGLHSSRPCYAIEYQGRCIAMFGVNPDPLDQTMGLVWLLGSDEIQDIGRQFLRESSSWLQRISQDYELLTNVVHEDNHLHHKWLRFLGFAFIRREKPFIEFARIA
jgi:hypothetical protein